MANDLIRLKLENTRLEQLLFNLNQKIAEQDELLTMLEGSASIRQRLLGLQQEQQFEREKRIELIIQQRRLKIIMPCFIYWRNAAKSVKNRRTQLIEKITWRMNRALASNVWRLWIMNSGLSRLQYSNNPLELKYEVLKRKHIATLIKYWRVRNCSQLFLRWQNVSRRSNKRKETLIGNVGFRMQHASILYAWKKWRNFIGVEKSNAVHGQFLTVLNKRKAEYAINLIDKKRKACIVPIFREWRMYARNRRQHKLNMLKKIVLKRLSSQLQHSFQTWKLFTAQLKRNEVEQQFFEHSKAIAELQQGLIDEKFRRAQVIIKASRLRTSTKAFISWKSFTRTVKSRKTHLLRNIILLWHKRSLWRAWHQWDFYMHADQRLATIDLQSQLESSRAQISALSVELKSSAQELVDTRKNYDDLRADWMVVKMRCNRLTACQDKLVCYFRRFRLNVSQRLQKELKPFCSRHCRCDVCTRRARSTIELVLELMVQFDRDAELRSLLLPPANENSKSSSKLLSASSTSYDVLGTWATKMLNQHIRDI